ncbi:alpha/beta hydrolase [Variovorax sp.]|uniref:alpha/beta hydrolase n=1 Tax=Variovorax sp. TaxID=1871043 RepID=UPI0037DA000A
MMKKEPIWKDREIAALRQQIQQLSNQIAEPSGELAAQRTAFDAFGASVSLPDDLEVKPIEFDGIDAEVLRTPAMFDRSMLLYLHGGGYCGGSPAGYRGLASKLASAIGVPALVPSYRLAPEHPFPAAIEDGVRSYEYLLDAGFDAKRIVIGGDSAGGGLAVAVALQLREKGHPQPAGLLTISPWSDLTQSCARLADRLHDPITQPAMMQRFADYYLQKVRPDHPLASPAFADLDGLAPLLIQVGAQEVLLSDALQLAESAGIAGVDVHMEIWPEMVHVWHLYADWLGAGRRAIAAAAEWARRKLDLETDASGTAATPRITRTPPTP